MAITTYAELKTAVANWSARSDTIFTDRVPEAVAMVEGWLAHGMQMGGLKMEPLRIRAMEASADITIDAGTESLPARFLQNRRFYLNTSPKVVLDYYPPNLFYETFASGSSGQPRAYTTEGENFVFAPSPDGTYTGKVLYYQQFAAFSSNGDSNSLLTSSPNIYLFGALYAMTQLLQSHPMEGKWLASFVGSVNARNQSDRKDRFGGAQLVSRVPVAP